MNDWPELARELASLEEQGLRRRQRICQPMGQGWMDVDGRRVRDFSGNDYLALASDPRVLAAAKLATDEGGAGSRGSALVCGRTPWLAELEARLAEFEATEAALVFPTGMAANVGVIHALVASGDVVFCDRWNHASLVDGCRLSGAALRVYRHDDLGFLQRALARADEGQRRWIVTDSVFSMDGDQAPLVELCELAEQYSARLIVDEAHATGLHGDSGRGVCEALGVEDRVAVRIGTLSKALGSLGGFVTGPKVLIEYLWNTARTQMFSTALPPGVCAAALRALEIVRAEPERRQQLAEHGLRFRHRLMMSGVPTPASATGPIVPIILGDARVTLEVAARLESRGFLVGAIRPPTVAQGTSRLRISLSLNHARAVIDELAEVLIQEIPESCRVGAGQP